MLEINGHPRQNPAYRPALFMRNIDIGRATKRMQGDAMQDAAMIRRFKGAVQLVTLHLWRVGKTTDVDICIEKAKELGMIGDDDEAFIT